jgi:hypothetical protein
MSKEEIERIFPKSGILKQVAKLVHSDFVNISDEIEHFLEISDKSQNVHKELPLVLISFDSGFSASAYKSGETEVISISNGAIIMIYKFFFMLMSMKSFLPHIGNVELETNKKVSLEEIPSEIADLSYDNLKPNCPKRLSYANFLSKVAIFYLFGHEIAHIRRGHFSLKLDTVLFEEFGGGLITASNTVEMIEIDADSVSANLCMLYLCHVMKNLDQDSENAWAFENTERLIELISNSVNFATFLFSNTIEWMINPESVKKYPPAIARSINLNTQIGVFCESVFNIEFAEIAPLIGNNYENFHLTLFSIISPALNAELKSQFEFYQSQYSGYLDDILPKRRSLVQNAGVNNLYQNVIT